jgi:hypothetical protein
MEPYPLWGVPSNRHTWRMGLKGASEQRRAVLPLRTSVRRAGAVTRRLEERALGADSRVRVVPCANAKADTSGWGRTDATGGGARSVFSAVQGVAPQDPRRARPVHACGDVEAIRPRRLVRQAGGKP